MSQKVELISTILREGIPLANIVSQESGSIYGFRIEGDSSVRWLYLDRIFLDDHEETEIANLFDTYNVTDALQDERQPQRLYFDGVQLVEYLQ